jgi:hypothetical protein
MGVVQRLSGRLAGDRRISLLVRVWPLTLPTLAVLLLVAGMNDPLGISEASARYSEHVLLRLARPWLYERKPDGGFQVPGQRDVVVIAVDNDATASVALEEGGWPLSWPPTYQEWTVLLQILAEFRPSAVFIDAYFLTDHVARANRFRHDQISEDMYVFAKTISQLRPSGSPTSEDPIPVAVGSVVSRNIGDVASQARPAYVVEQLFAGGCVDVGSPEGYVSKRVAPVPVLSLALEAGASVPVRPGDGRVSEWSETLTTSCMAPEAAGSAMGHTGGDFGPAAWAYLHHRCRNAPDCRAETLARMGWGGAPSDAGALRILWPSQMSDDIPFQVQNDAYKKSETSRTGCGLLPAHAQSSNAATLRARLGLPDPDIFDVSVGSVPLKVLQRRAARFGHGKETGAFAWLSGTLSILWDIFKLSPAGDRATAALACTGIPTVMASDLLRVAQDGPRGTMAASSWNTLLAGHVVMIGRIADGVDKHAVDERMYVSGVYLHAAALRQLISQNEHYLRTSGVKAGAGSLCRMPSRYVEATLLLVAVVVAYMLFHRASAVMRWQRRRLAAQLMRLCSFWGFVVGCVGIAVAIRWGHCSLAPLNWLGFLYIGGIHSLSVLIRQPHWSLRPVSAVAASEDRLVSTPSSPPRPDQS